MPRNTASVRMLQALTAKRERDASNAYVKACGRYMVPPGGNPGRKIARHRGIVGVSRDGRQAA